MPDKKEKEDSDNKIREMTKDIVNELLKSGEPVRIDISTGASIAKCGSKFIQCGDYDCKKNFTCEAPKGFKCTGAFADAAKYTLAL